MARILYFCPDFPQPSGGIKTLYRNVHFLCEMGMDALIVHQKRDFRLTWHGYTTVPILWLEDRPQFGADDIWVLPEIMLDLMQKSQGFAGQRIVLALSWSPDYARLQPSQRWQDYGITEVITKSPTIQRHLAWSMEIDVTLIPDSIDPALYHYEPAQKRPQIAYMTRKDRSGEWLRGVLTRKYPQLTEYNWLALREMDEATYAQNLRESTVYLATTLQEGLHISVLEAMACGCLVVGYSGIGGNDYMQGAGEMQNAIIIENGNLLLLGQKLEEVLLKLQTAPDHYLNVIQNGIATALHYQDAEAEREGLRKFFTKQ